MECLGTLNFELGTLLGTRLPAMFMRNCGLALLAALVMLGAGCKKSAPETKAPERTKSPPVTAKAAPDSAARVHWLGMKRLLAETNAATFKTLWEMPQSTYLLAQTLNKLALAPWRASIPELQGAATNYPFLITNYPSLVKNHPLAFRLRPLLEELVQEECYFELRPQTNSRADMVLAVRLDEQRSAAWQTNLLAIAENLTGNKAPADPTNGWSLPLHPQSATLDPRRLSLTHSGAWTLLSLSGEKSTLLSDLTSRVKSHPSGNPFEPVTTNYWIEAHLDLQRLWPELAQKLNLPAELPQTTLTFIGDGKDVQTRGTFTFSKPLPFNIEPWNIPTNLLHEQLDSSTGLQGIQPWLGSLKYWKDLNIGEPPNQIFCWARLGIPFHSYCAASTTNANQLLDKIRGYLLADGNKWLATNATGYFENATNGNALLWKVVPFMAPVIESETLTNGPFFVAGFAPNTSTNPPPSAETLANVVNRTNLFYYDWEMTGPRLEEWLYLGQLLRVMFHKPQMPGKALGLVWVKALEQSLRESRTALAKTSPQQVSFARTSSMGFTAAEIHVLADWLESPRFPIGLHTFTAKRVASLHPFSTPTSTNSAARK